jgi:hypothetical protein
VTGILPCAQATLSPKEARKQATIFFIFIRFLCYTNCSFLLKRNQKPVSVISLVVNDLYDGKDNNFLWNKQEIIPKR